jgi:WD40 repeat protein
MELRPGTKLGPYQIISPIGAGGIGQVWKARDTRLGRIVAIKTSHVVPLANAIPAATTYSMIQWSPAGDWIAYPSADGISMVSQDGNTVRKVTARKLLAFAFTKEGTQVGIARNNTDEGAEWQLWSVDVKTGTGKMRTPIDLAGSTNQVAGFSLHPDGKSFLTSIAKWPYDIWIWRGLISPGRAFSISFYDGRGENPLRREVID